ncbi:MAG TPA: efflux RND transporter permease subunit [Bryobacteraceae bacterium]|nr:efflux RND transporter permease subunit [Bryobacteraceae bacterium]
MLAKLVELSIRFRGVVIALACLVAAYGYYTIRNAKFDVYPEFAPPQVTVQTEAPGLSSLDVESLVTRPIESALNGTPNLTAIRSNSIQGLSVVVATFEDSVDVYRARQMVSERMSEAADQMPLGVRRPALAPLVGATSLTLIVGLTSDTRTPMELRTFADWTMRPRLLGVPGVARVAIFGGEIRQLQIQLHPDRLAAFGLSMSDVVAAARNATAVRGAGFLETDAQRIVLQTQGQSLTPAELGEVVLSSKNGRSVRMKDVAFVTNGAEPKIGDATIMGQPGIMIHISGQYGANTVEVTRAIEQALDELKPAISAQKIRLYPDLFRPANFINEAIRNIGYSLLVGAALVGIVLFLFLFNMRVAVISLTAIPLSLFIAVILLDRWGVSLNTLTLGGLAIAIGEVVDDAIIDAENIFRRLREAPKPLGAADVFRIVRDASVEVRSAVVYATFVVALVFLPVLRLSGVQGRLFAPLAWSYILAILASLLVALTLTPAMCYAMLPGALDRVSEPEFVVRLKHGYGKLVGQLAGHTGLIIAASVLVCLAAAAVVPFMGGEFLPELREGHFIVHMNLLPGSSLKETVRVGKIVTRELLRNPGVRLVSQQIGRAEAGDDTEGVHSSEIHIDLKPGSSEDPEKTEEELREAVANVPGPSVSINPFLAERMDEIIAGSTAQVVVNVFGDDLDLLDQKAAEIARVLNSVKGATDVRVESPPGTPQLTVRLRPDRLRQFGFQPGVMLEEIQAAYQGAQVGEIYEKERVFGVDVILDEGSRADTGRIGDLLFQNADGVRVPLRELADIELSSGRYNIPHTGTRRRQTVGCDVSGRDLASFVADVRRSIGERIKLPAASYITIGGASQAREAAQREILVYSVVAGAGILMLLSIVFASVRNMLLVLANLPFALVGGVVAVMLTGNNLSVGSLVGFVTLFGITMRNSIMMISHFEHLVQQEGETWGLSAAIRGASERLTPVLMTAIVTALGLLPLAIGRGAGREIEGPMALVILGGLGTSTILNLLVLPALALRFGRFRS